MKTKRFCVALLVFALTSFSGYAKIYVNEGFEQFNDGEDIGKVSDLWELSEPQDNPIGSGISSSKLAFTGKKSAIFDDARCMGFAFATLKLPEKYVVSTWFYHDSKQMPPPDAVVIMVPEAFPGGGNFWQGIGTRTQAVKLENYAYRDKTGTGIYEDTKIPRRTAWVQFVFSVQPDATDFYVDGKKVYTVKIDAKRYNGYEITRTPSWGKQIGEVFIDDVIVADNVGEVPTANAVTYADKLSVTWGNVKQLSLK